MLIDHRHSADCPWQWFAACRCHLAAARNAIIRDVTDRFRVDLARIITEHRK